MTYLYPYGRLIGRLESDLALSLGSFRQIDSVWSRLARGETVACAPIPPRVTRGLAGEDLGRETLFGPAVIALENATQGINASISAFEDLCANPEGELTLDYITTQTDLLAEVERNLLLAGSFLEPLRSRNPQLDTTDSPFTGGY
jgi:hypothetical protein